MYWNRPLTNEGIPLSGLSRLTMTALMIAIVWLGFYPKPILQALDKPR